LHHIGVIIITYIIFLINPQPKPKSNNYPMTTMSQYADIGQDVQIEVHCCCREKMCYQMTAFKFGSKGMLIVLLTLVEVPMFLNQGMKTRSIRILGLLFIHSILYDHSQFTFTFYINIPKCFFI